MIDTKPYEEKMEQAFVHFEDELKKVRTGRAHPNMLDSITVTVYGAKMPLNQTANVTVPEAGSLTVTPFDPANLQAIVEAIRNDQTLGMNPSDDGRAVHVPIPALNEERRLQIVKQLGDKAEECRIALRNIRHDALKEAKRQKEEESLSEDHIKRVEKSFNQLMDSFNTRIDGALGTKEQEIMTV